MKPSDIQHVVLGRVGAPYGVKGWLHINSFTRPTNNIEQYTHWQLRQGRVVQQVEVLELKTHQKRYAVKLHGIDDRDSAAALTNANIEVPSNDLPNLEHGEFYWTDLIGLTALTPKGHTLGVVTELMETGANDVIVIESPQQRHLVPYIDQCVLEIDLKKKTILVDWDPDF
jgi:16S rRNA processing protein RimM